MRNGLVSYIPVSTIQLIYQETRMVIVSGKFSPSENCSWDPLLKTFNFQAFSLNLLSQCVFSLSTIKYFFSFLENAIIHELPNKIQNVKKKKKSFLFSF